MITRRKFLKTTAAASGAALLGLPLTAGRPALPATRRPDHDRPNILLIMLDQQRAQPDNCITREISDAVMPSLKRLRQGAVVFDGCYAAATACSPSRGALLTGLYPHQTGLITTDGPPLLDTGFKTWGSALRNEGYDTHWFGKWHVSREFLTEKYGFSGVTDMTTLIGKREGIDRDPIYMQYYLDWFDQNSGKGPWATAVSLINPHDICEFTWPEIQDYAKQHPAQVSLNAMPANFETEEQLKTKPNIQQIISQECVRRLMTKSTDGVKPPWPEYLNTYLALQALVDAQITRILDALDKRPEVRDNTIIVFLADHGEYLGSHGLGGKAYALYDEATKIPLIVKDPTGRWAKRPDVERKQLVSMVDIHGLMLTLATGSNDWRAKPEHAPLKDRLDVAAILQNPRAPGRDYILHTCDEWSPIPLMTRVGVAQNHIVGLFTADAKLGVYSDWQPDATVIVPDTQQFELYDYSTPAGRAETDNIAESNPVLLGKMRDRLIKDVIPTELNAPLPPGMTEARDRGLATYFDLFHKRLAPVKPHAATPKPA